MPLEADIISILCGLVLSGTSDVKVPYQQEYNLGYVKVDCLTDDAAIEVGLDKRSSLDSLQQSIFAASLTGKHPMIAIIDRDGIEGKYEYRIRKAAEAVGVEYRSYKAQELIRFQMTAYLRERRSRITQIN